jgi:hypothetical protein
VLVRHGVPDLAAKTIVVVGIFAFASVLSRAGGALAGRMRARSEALSAGSPLLALARRETAASLFQTTVRYSVFLIALILALVAITGAHAVSTLAGASFLVILIGFAAQRFLLDVVAGLLMFFEGWYTVGSSIVVEPFKLEGVVEEVSLRATTLRVVTGEVVRVNNSQIAAVRLLPDGTRRVAIELFVRDREAGELLVERVGAIVPKGPTSFVDPPHVREAAQLDEALHRVTAEASVAAGSLWLANDLLPSLLKERASDGLIVHGPVVLPIDEQATHRFARVERRAHRRRHARSGREPASPVSQRKRETGLGTLTEDP